jgi:transcriptional regulator with XRE-family HTH domain
MDQVQRLIDAGASIPNAVKVSLGQRGLSLAAFAIKHGISRSHVSRAIAGSERPTTSFLEALISELGGDRDSWKVLLHEAGRPIVAAGSA